MRKIDQYSVSTVPIEMFFRDTPLAIGTAFVWENDGRFFLITNWHNVTGIDPFSGKHVSPTGGEPDRLLVGWNRKEQLTSKFAAFESLRDADGQPRWWVHPEHGNQVDVVAIPVTPHPDAEMYPINKMRNAPLDVRVGLDVFVLGYPYGIGPGGLPIWKRGSIAFEPQMGVPGYIHMLIDTASRPGMSGSPVIRRSWGAHFYEDGGTSLSDGDATRFVGVYSGRLSSADPLDAQLGLAWEASLLAEIIAGEKRDI